MMTSRLDIARGEDTQRRGCRDQPRHFTTPT